MGVTLRPAVTCHLVTNHFWMTSVLGLLLKGSLKHPTKHFERKWRFSSVTSLGAFAVRSSGSFGHCEIAAVVRKDLFCKSEIVLYLLFEASPKNCKNFPCYVPPSPVVNCLLYYDCCFSSPCSCFNSDVSAITVIVLINPVKVSLDFPSPSPVKVPISP